MTPAPFAVTASNIRPFRTAHSACAPWLTFKSPGKPGYQSESVRPAMAIAKPSDFKLVRYRILLVLGGRDCYIDATEEQYNISVLKEVAYQLLLPLGMPIF
jgi:hypothetical protein